MCDVPVPVADEERVIRGICTPYHVDSSGKLKPQAFEAPYENDKLSVMRGEYLSAHECKRRAQLLTRPGKLYRGVAVLRVRRVRAIGPDVVDSRAIYLGHADIVLPHKRPKQEPPGAGIVKLLRDQGKALAKTASYYADPNPEGQTWDGPALGCE